MKNFITPGQYRTWIDTTKTICVIGCHGIAAKISKKEAKGYVLTRLIEQGRGGCVDRDRLVFTPAADVLTIKI